MRTILLLTLLCGLTAEGYDPNRVPADFVPQIRDLEVVDAERDRRLPIRVYLPLTQQPAPVILFSHGLGGARTNNPYLGTHWSARGYVAVFLQHPGSDENLWKNKSKMRAWMALKGAANAQNARLRFEDVPQVIDALTRWHTSDGHDLAKRLDLDRIGMSGHSFGAVTTQAVSGQRWPEIQGYTTTDWRIKAAVIMSPNANPKHGDARRVFGSVAIPWLLMTGTKDLSRVGTATLETRLAVYPALPPGSKYQVVLHNAEHYAFGDRQLPKGETPRNPNHHRVILALTTAFWDAHLKGDPAAQGWLKGDGPRQVLEADDSWEHK